MWKHLCPPDGGDVDDGPGLDVNHVGQDGLDGVEGPVDVDGKEPTPKLVRDVLELVLFGDAGVVHQEVYRAERFLYGSDGGGDGVPVGDVGLDR